jgi:hypothetical protein
MYASYSFCSMQVHGLAGAFHSQPRPCGREHCHRIHETVARIRSTHFRVCCVYISCDMYTISLLCTHCIKYVYRTYTYAYICIQNIYICILTGGCGLSGGYVELTAQLRAVGLALPTRSLLRPTDMMIEEKGNLPGEFALQLKRTRRNSRDVTLEDEVFNKIQQCARTGLAILRPTDRTAVRLDKGVKMNGRPVSRGDVCVVAHQVNRLHSEDAGSESSQGVCTVCCFYQVKCGDTLEVFADVLCVETTHKIRSMFIMKKSSVGLSGLTHTFIHADRIVAKLHIVPHFDDNTLVCAIPMWDTR